MAPMSTMPIVRPAIGPESDGAFGDTPWAHALNAARAYAPYLARLLRRREDLLVDLDADWPDRLVRSAIGDAEAIVRELPSTDEAMHRLRRGKDCVHLGAAIADLARAWPTMQVTRALSEFADAAVRAALAVCVRDAVVKGDLRDTATPDLQGFALIALGKMGAFELNYSSDIDFSVFFDPEALPLAEGREARVIAVRLVSNIVRVLEEITGDGYVFRTDLRLRPDPGSTLPAVSIVAAERYYQSVGQNWERAAFIKARAIAGDLPCAEAFLDTVRAFVWRRNLDFAAVADIKSIKRQILANKGGAEIEKPVFNVKLARGGIRDIELFVQTQQLILGGRNPELRAPGTLQALEALADAEVISTEDRAQLSSAYLFYRDVEHRAQMLEDSQTHDVPADIGVRTRLAALSGFAAVAEFEGALVSWRKTVSAIDWSLFGDGESLADISGSLIFTGVEDDPETLETLRRMGFEKPAAVSETIRGWHHGRIRAMRTERARELLTALTPRLLRALAEAGDADVAFTRFSAFFSGLLAGVTVLSLFEARPALLDLLARLFALTPVLSATLAQRPALLDAMIEDHFAAPLEEDAPGLRREALQARLVGCEGFEEQINEARRMRREEALRIGVQVLNGEASAAAAGAAYADLAEACVAEMAAAAMEEVERLFGPQPGAYAVLALGKFGGRELSAGSDLDVMIVYDAPATSDAKLMPGEFYTRFTQRLVSALAAQTEEGALYEVDMALRPSGKAGPVAVRWSAFERYYVEDAWTWELQAITRLRAVAGDRALGQRAEAHIRDVLSQPRDADKLLADVADMRARMERDKPASHNWDIKLARGGLVDVEFIAQGLQIAHAPHALHVVSPSTHDALMALADAGILPQDDAASLSLAFSLYSNLQQILRLCGDGAFNPNKSSEGLRRRLAEIAGDADFATLEAHLLDVQADVRKRFVRLIGPVS